MKKDEKNLIVRQSNELIEASYKIASIGEGRFIRMLIAQISPSDEDFRTYRISIADFANFFGLSKDSNSVYELIRNSADELAGRRIMIEKDGRWLRLNWLSYAEYIPGNGYVEVRIDKSLKPYLLQLQTHWKEYALENIVNFRSGYSIRIFELLKVEEFKANSKGYFQRGFDYIEMRNILGVDKSEYLLFADFRINAIEVAVREINNNNDIKITKVEYLKTGRKISHVVFHCEKAKQLQLNIDDPLPNLEEVDLKNNHPDYISELIAIGIDEQTAYRWKRKYTVARLREAITYTKAMQDAGKIRDSVTGFLARAVTDNIGATWVDAQKKQQVEKSKRENLERDKAKVEDQKAQKQAEETKRILAIFEERSQEEQWSIKEGFFESLNSNSKQLFEKCERDVTKPMFRAQFREFFKSNYLSNE